MNLNKKIETSVFDYDFNPNQIAQDPCGKRDCSRLLVLNRKDKTFREEIFKNIVDFFNPGDVLVLNDTKVIPARIFGHKKTGAKIELLLLEELSPGVWTTLISPAKRLKVGDSIFFGDGKFYAKVLQKAKENIIEFNSVDVKAIMGKFGEMPTPPYIKKKLDNNNKYQTVYAQNDGAVAAPTAGLHFTDEVFKALQEKGVIKTFITLHVGLGTFKPIKTDDINSHPMAEERYIIPQTAADIINKAKTDSRKIISVGTTATRALESSAKEVYGKFMVESGFKRTKLYITPGYKFKIVDRLLTNFHLPRSTNLVLVSSFAGMDFVKKAYDYAVENNFRLYSFGDAMFVI